MVIGGWWVDGHWNGCDYGHVPKSTSHEGGSIAKIHLKWTTHALL